MRGSDDPSGCCVRFIVERSVSVGDKEGFGDKRVDVIFFCSCEEIITIVKDEISELISI